MRVLLEKLKVPTGSRRVNEIVAVRRKHIRDVSRGGLVGDNGGDGIVARVDDGRAVRRKAVVVHQQVVVVVVIGEQHVSLPCRSLRRRWKSV